MGYGDGGERDRLRRVRRGRDYDLQPGDPAALGGYALLGRLGSGAYGVVYEGESRDGEPAAVKLLRGPVDWRYRQRFEREVTALRTVSSPRVVAYLDHGESPYGLWLATELVTDARTLEKDNVYRGGLRLLAIIRDMLVALRDLHSAGITHRDLHPDNVMISRKGGVKLIDLGLSLHGDERVTASNGNIGKVVYTPPEQRGVQLPEWDPASDVFAWAATSVFACQRRAPQTNQQAFLGPRPPEDYDLSGVETSLAPLLRDCLSPRPSDRPSTDRVLRELRHIRADWRARDERDCVSTVLTGTSHFDVDIYAAITQWVGIATYLHWIRTDADVKSPDGRTPAFVQIAAGMPATLHRWSVSIEAARLRVWTCPSCGSPAVADGTGYRCSAPLTCRDQVRSRIRCLFAMPGPWYPRPLM
ncbi:MAG: protein kinase domain-containing protein [Mycobacterium leprae]